MPIGHGNLPTVRIQKYGRTGRGQARICKTLVPLRRELLEPPRGACAPCNRVHEAARDFAFDRRESPPNLR
jgi:hypothetical protein